MEFLRPINILDETIGCVSGRKDIADEVPYHLRRDAAISKEGPLGPGDIFLIESLETIQGSVHFIRAYHAIVSFLRRIFLSMRGFLLKGFIGVVRNSFQVRFR